MPADPLQNHVRPVGLPEGDIRHRINKDPCRLPRERFIEVAQQESRPEGLKMSGQAGKELEGPSGGLDMLHLLVGFLNPESSGEGAGITICAVVSAAPDWIPDTIAPIDLRPVRHRESSTSSMIRPLFRRVMMLLV